MPANATSSTVNGANGAPKPFDVAKELGEDILNGLEVNGLGISPILEVMVANPLTIDASIAALITPIFEGEADAESAINITATIKKAIFDEATGEVTPTTTRLVLAKEEYKANYPESEGYTFIECNLDNLFHIHFPTRRQQFHIIDELLMLVEIQGSLGEKLFCILQIIFTLEFWQHLDLPRCSRRSGFRKSDF